MKPLLFLNIAVVVYEFREQLKIDMI